MGSPPERVDMCGEMEADWIEQIKCRRMKLKEMKEPERKGRERCSRAF